MSQTNSEIEFIPQHDGVIARCGCGSEMRLPSSTIRRFGLVWCPCGLLQQIGVEVLNKISVLHIQAYMAEGLRT